MYEQFFQFQSRPFPAAPVVANYFPAQGMEAARHNLIRLIERAEGPGLVIGPAGVGKTLLLRVLSDHFSQAFRVVMLSGTRVTTRKSLLQSILFELELPYRGLDEGELRLALIDALRRNNSIPRGILLLIDEAQTLPLRLLDEARLITNVAQDGVPRVRLILSGSPQLEERFTNPKLESFNQRIAARCYLQAFSRDETHEFVRAEVSWAGGDPDSIFSEDTVRAIFQATDGIPRLINQICDHALMQAHATGQPHVNAARIQEAWADLQQLPPPWQPTRPAVSATGSTVIEFGQLEDDTELPKRSAVEDRTPIGETDPYVAQNDSPCIDREPMIVEFQSDTLMIDPPFMDGSLEWVTCGEQTTSMGFERHIEPDPFDDSFDEEIVVIDRSTARNLDIFRGRPRVTCSESRELAASLSRIQGMQGAAESSQVCDDSACLVTDSLAGPTFEFSTLQDLPEIDFQTEFDDELTSVDLGTDEQIELDFDEEIDCVPLPWTRGSLGDDRDIIVVEEDSPRLGLSGGVDATTDGARRTEYRDLFAQLRRVST